MKNKTTVHQRVANTLKVISMIAFVGSLIYFYAYSPESSRLNENISWIFEYSRATLFYVSLTIFTIFNLIMSYSLNMYQRVRGTAKQSLFFRSEAQKLRLLVWLNYFTAGANFLFTTLVLFIALSRINEIMDLSVYLFIPLIGITVFSIIFVGLIVAVFRK